MLRLKFGLAFLCMAIATVGTADAQTMYTSADFSTNSADYTLTRILDNSGGLNNLAAVHSGNDLSFTSTVHAGPADQYAYTLNGLSLGIGDEVNVDFSFLKTSTGSGSEAIGLYVGKAPTTGVREHYVTSYLNNADFDYKARGHQDTASEYTNEVANDVAGLTSLFITRVAADEFETGYYVGATRNLVATRTGIDTANDGSAVGFYIDSRGVGNIAGATVGASAVPEPSSLALLGLAGMTAMIRRRR